MNKENRKAEIKEAILELEQEKKAKHKESQKRFWNIVKISCTLIALSIFQSLPSLVLAIATPEFKLGNYFERPIPSIIFWVLQIIIILLISILTTIIKEESNNEV